MRNNRGRRSWALLAVMGLLAWADDVRADAMRATIDYSTSGTIGTEGVDGSGVVRFAGLDHAAFYDRGPVPSPLVGQSSELAWDFALGEFRVEALAPGVSTRYDRTPFAITARIDGVGPLTFTGTLDGTITGADQSNVRAWFDPGVLLESNGAPTRMDLPFAFQSGDLLNSILSIRSGFRLAAPQERGAVRDGGVIEGIISPRPVPEPASIALFACIAGLGLWRGSRGSRPGA